MIVTTGRGEGRVLACEERPDRLLNFLQCTGQLPPTKNYTVIQPQMPIVPTLRNRGLRGALCFSFLLINLPWF